jgi:hypothetical protein
MVYHPQRSLQAKTSTNSSLYWYQQEPKQGGGVGLVPTAPSRGRTGTNRSLKREDWYQQQLIPFPVSQEGSAINDDWYRSPASVLVDWIQRSCFGGDLRHWFRHQLVPTNACILLQTKVHQGTNQCVHPLANQEATGTNQCVHPLANQGTTGTNQCVHPLANQATTGTNQCVHPLANQATTGTNQCVHPLTTGTNQCVHLLANQATTGTNQCVHPLANQATTGTNQCHQNIVPSGPRISC